MLTDEQLLELFVDNFDRREVRPPRAAVKYAPGQPRDNHGRFSHTIGVEGGRARPKKPKQTAEEFLLAETGLTYQDVVENYRGALREATQAQRDDGMNWYQDAHDKAARDAKHYGTETEQQAGMLAALSPQADWAVNVRACDMVNEALARKRTTITDADNIARREASIAQSMKTYRNNQTALDKAIAQHHKTYEEMSKWVGEHDTSSIPAHILAQTIDAKVLKSSVEKAVKIGRGADPDGVLKGFKVRSFYNNISAPEVNGYVTVDTHMINKGAGGKRQGLTTGRTAGKAPSSVPRRTFADASTYDLFGNAVRDAAASEGIKSHEAQAIIWNVQRDQYKHRR